MKDNPPVVINPIDLEKARRSKGKKYVAFDIGNVLVHSTFPEFLKKLSKQLNITVEEAEYFMNRTQKLHDLGCTRMADELRDHFKIRSQVIIEELIQAWKDIIKPDYWVITKLDELIRNENLQVALVSNIGLEHAEQIVPLLTHIHNPWTNQWYESSFKKAIQHFSCFVGARKPSLLYYQSFLQLYPQFQGCVYVDDLHENLNASKQFGFQTFHFSLETVTEDNWTTKLEELVNFILNAK